MSRDLWKQRNQEGRCKLSCPECGRLIYATDFVRGLAKISPDLETRHTYACNTVPRRLTRLPEGAP